MSIDQSLATSPTVGPVRRSSHPAVIAGVAAGPVFVTTILAQAVTRDGFDLVQHPLSLLALGDHGWIQTLNFVACGTAFIAAVVVEGNTTGALGRWTRRMLVVFGAALVAAGVFRTDPWHGYPLGADESTTWTGVVHNTAAAVGGLALVAASFIVARSAQRHGRRTLAATSAVVGAGYLALSIAGSAIGDFRIALLAGAVTWCWASTIIADSQRSAPASQRRP